MKLKLFLILVISVFAGWLAGLHSFTVIGNDQRTKLDIIHYDLDLRIDLKNRLLFGNAKLTGKILSEMKTIRLDFYDNLKITALSVNGYPAEFIHKDTVILIDYSSNNDTFIIDISYEGRPKRGGLSGFVFGERNKQPAVYNLNEPDYASTWFPCNDIPSDKALLDIKITNELHMVSVSNGILVDTAVSGELKTYHWRTIYPVSTYLICIYSAPYVSFSDQYVSLDGQDTMSIDYYVFEDHLENAKKDFEDHPDMMKFFAHTFGEYPFIKEKYGVAEFLWQLGAMEHQTITGIGSNFVSGKKYFNDVYVHELAHHWWGNAVGPGTWKDIWLNEGFATYSEALYHEYKEGPDALQAKMLSKFDDKPEVRLYAPEGSIFSSTIYDKGAWVLHMLRWETGDSVFFQILRNYFETYKYKTAVTDDFKNIAEITSGKDLDRFFKQWVTEGDDIINAVFKWNAGEDNGKRFIRLEIRQEQTQFMEYHFPLELEIQFEGNEKQNHIIYIDSRHKIIELAVDKPPAGITLDPGNHLLARFRNLPWD